MNLYDLVKRADRTLECEGDVTAAEVKRPGGGQRAVYLAEGASLRVRCAHEVTALRSLPQDPQWSAELEKGGRLQVAMVSAAGASVLASYSGAGIHPVRIRWPVPVPTEYDLVLTMHGGGGQVAVGPLFNPRVRLLPVLIGFGVEVGPGTNPAVRPEPGRQVRYVEKMSAEQWAATYGKASVGTDAAELWSHYVVDSAHRLDGFADESLGFVFSSHVIEHLVNPLQVFENWWRKLAPGGVIAGVVPDARYTFDLRQPLSTSADFLDQHRAGGFEPDEAMYERWCKYTAPYNTPRSLRERQYSIHVNYFSVEGFRLLIDLFAERYPVGGVFMESVPNGKDFGFLISKP